MHLKTITLLLIAAIAGNSAMSKEERIIPDQDLNNGLNFGPDVLKNLLNAHLRVFPGSLPHERIFFMTNLDRLAYQQQDLIRRIQRVPGYTEEMKSRTTLMDMVITTTRDYSFEAKSFNPEPLRAWSKRMTELLTRWPAEKFIDATNAQIAEEYDEYIDKRWGWRESETAYARMFEERVAAVVMAYGITNHGKSTDILKKPIEFSEGDLDYLVEKALWKKALEGAAGKLPEKKREGFFDRMEYRLGDKYQHLGGSSAYDGPRTHHIQAGEKLFVYEVHPDLAVLRGFVGNDCSTSVSFGYPYSPYERNYYVTNEKKQFLGYVALSLVGLRKTRSIFFHTIAGPNITHGQADMLLRAFQASRLTIGGKHMALPEDYRIGENINFRPIDQMMRKHVATSKLEDVTWLDREYRRVISENGSDTHYDDPDRNRVGRVMDADASDLNIQISYRPYQSPLLDGSVGCPEVLGENAVTRLEQ